MIAEVRYLRVGDARSNLAPTLRDARENLRCAAVLLRYAARDVRTIVTGGRR